MAQNVQRRPPDRGSPCHLVAHSLSIIARQPFLIGIGESFRDGTGHDTIFDRTEQVVENIFSIYIHVLGMGKAE